MKNIFLIPILFILFWIQASQNTDISNTRDKENNELVSPRSIGMDLEVFFLDVPSIEQAKEQYTAEVYVLDYKKQELFGPFKGSTYPDSNYEFKSFTRFNKIFEGAHVFNNISGHSAGTKKGLNIVISKGLDRYIGRKCLGYKPSNEYVIMSYVNVHVGKRIKKGSLSRGSAGCLTIEPKFAQNFFNLFDFKYITRGNSTGAIYVFRINSNLREDIINELESTFL